LIIIDFSGIAHAMTVIAWKNTMEATIDNDYTNPLTWEDDTEEFSFDERFALELRARILHTLLEVKKTYSRPGEEIVIAVDSRFNWRKMEFKEYKANRKARREEDPIDWDMVFSIHNKLLDDIRENFYFKVIKWENHDDDISIGCEADDIIAVLARYKAGREPVTIISDDSDFYQLHDIPQLEQYNYRKVRKTRVHACKSLKISEDTEVTPEQYRLMKTLDGDRKDGVPNFQNDNDVWLDVEKKYKRLGGKTALKIIMEDPETVTKFGNLDIIKKSRGFIRNDEVINLHNVPSNIQEGIIDQYLNYQYKGSLQKIQRYISQYVATGSNHLYDSARRFVIDGIVSEPSGRINPFRRFIKS
jgi:5'-3' exonuclease